MLVLELHLCPGLLYWVFIMHSHSLKVDVGAIYEGWYYYRKTITSSHGGALGFVFFLVFFLVNTTNATVRKVVI